MNEGPLSPQPQERTYWYFLPGNFKFFAVFILPAALGWICAFKGYDDAILDARGIEHPRIGREWSNVYVMILTGSYWSFDCMPLAAAGIVPLLILPLFLVVEAPQLAYMYVQDVGMMTFSSCILVFSGISSGFSKRLAHKIFALVGTDLRRVMFLCMLLSGLMSMWFVNTAVMLFMCDVVEEIRSELVKGTDIGTLGDLKMQEWKAALSEGIVKKQVHHQETKQEDGPEVPVTPQISESHGLAQPKPPETPEPLPKAAQEPAAPTSLDALEQFAENLGEAGSESDPDSKPKQKASGKDMAKKSKVSLLSQDTMYTASVVSELPSSDVAVRLKSENVELAESYKVDLLHAIAIAVNIGGLLWPYTSTSSAAIYYYTEIEPMPGTEPVPTGLPATIPMPRLLNQAQWMNFTFPIIVITFVFAVWWIDFYNFVLPGLLCFKGITLMDETAATAETRKRVQDVYADKGKSGKYTSHEILSITVLIASTACFALRRPEFLAGWSSYFTVPIKASTVATLFVVLSFIIPKCGRDMIRGPKSPEDKATFTALIGWKCVQQTFPWGLLIFIGAGTAIAHGCVKSGFNRNFLRELNSRVIGPTPYEYPWAVLLICIVATVFLANVLTNTAAAHIATNILTAFSLGLGFQPSYLSIPCVVACSFAVLLPAGTPPMAIAHMKTKKLGGLSCYARGWPICLFGLLVTYGFGLFYTDNLLVPPPVIPS